MLITIKLEENSPESVKQVFLQLTLYILCNNAPKQKYYKTAEKKSFKKKIKTVCQESLKAANAIERLGQIGSKNHS